MSGSALSDLKHEAIGECSRCDKAGTASFLNDFKHNPCNTLSREESLAVNVF